MARHLSCRATDREEVSHEAAAVLQRLALLMFLPTTQAQYGDPGEDLPQIAMLMNLVPRSSWIVFFCPDTDSCGSACGLLLPWRSRSVGPLDDRCQARRQNEPVRRAAGGRAQ